MGGIGAPELLIVLAVLLLVFGASRLPKLARSMGQAGKEFKSGLKEGYTPQEVEGPCPFCDKEVQPDAKFCANCGKSAEEIVAKKEETAKAS
jgi:sec-independent protein translocase protein TatA